MRLRNFLLLFGILSILTTGCQNEPMELSVQEKPHSTPNQPNKLLSPEEAYDNALPMIIQICSNQTRTKDFSFKRGGKVETIGLPYFTRSSPTDCLMYIINFSEGGFVIVGSNPNGRPLYAFSETGYFNISDTIYSHELKYFIDGAIAGAYKERLLTTNNTTPSDTIVYKIYRNISPLLPPKVAIWHQRSPYNNACPRVSLTERGSVGCGPLSIGMLMAYYNWPEKIDDVTLNWEGIETGTDNIQIGFLLQKVAELAGS
ncbi:MAG: hypothetical protein HDR80_08545 [Bacteroides sp.]|nr:hypothetical protein [Bacteroides sp.]